MLAKLLALLVAPSKRNSGLNPSLFLLLMIRMNWGRYERTSPTTIRSDRISPTLLWVKAALHVALEMGGRECRARKGSVGRKVEVMVRARDAPVRGKGG